MNDEVPPTSQRIVELTADLVSAYISNNQLSAGALPEVISSVYATISMLGKAAAEPEKPVPAVPIKRSVTPEYLISLEDGRQYKSLKRHLGRLGMTPEEYRNKWSLPPDYPMVAAEYAKRRSELAKSLGLGRKRAEPTAAPKPTGRRKNNADHQPAPLSAIQYENSVLSAFRA